MCRKHKLSSNSDTPLRRSARLKAKREPENELDHSPDLTTNNHLSSTELCESKSVPDILCSSQEPLPKVHRRAKRTSKSFVEEESPSKLRKTSLKDSEKDSKQESVPDTKDSILEEKTTRHKKKRKAIKEAESSPDLHRPKLKISKTSSVEDVLLLSDEVKQKKRKGKKESTTTTENPRIV